MKFWLGTHHPNWLTVEPDLFVSRRRLTNYKVLPEAVGEWALDSGAFTELNDFGEWRTTEREYISDVRRFEREIGNIAWVAPMDWMCEPYILEKTGKDVQIHQILTVQNFRRLRDELGPLVIPVLQGWTRDDYLWCVGEYDHWGVDLWAEPLVGVGSVCRRQGTNEATHIFRSLANLKLHGFGVKTSGFEAYGHLLASADSMAWSAQARWKSGDNTQDSLFDWPRKMLCGRVHPTEHKAKTCANCLDWARKWRDSILELEAA